MNIYHPISLWFCFPWVIITTEYPAIPVPLTVACVTTVFTPPGTLPKPLYGSSPLCRTPNTRPMPGYRWRRWSSPKKSQMISVIEAISSLANVRRANFLPAMTVADLDHGEGRKYPRHSLPGIVAWVTATYHHNPLPFFDHMETMTRSGFLIQHLTFLVLS